MQIIVIIIIIIITRNQKHHLQGNATPAADIILPQNAAKLTKKHGSELGVLLWRRLTPQRKTVIWVHNYSPSRGWTNSLLLVCMFVLKITSCGRIASKFSWQPR